MPDIDTDIGQGKETFGQKQKSSNSSRSKSALYTLKSNSVENGAKIDASPSHGEGPSTALSAALQEGVAKLSGNMANAISETFKSV